MSADLRALLQSSLLPAMRVGDKDTVDVVRSVLAAIANAEAVPVADAPALAPPTILQASPQVFRTPPDLFQTA